MVFWSFVIAVVFVYMIVYLVSESAQNYLYDNLVDGLWWRALVAALILGLVMAKYPLPIEDIFDQQLWPIAVQAALWSLAFWLVCRYQLGHAFALGILMYFISAWFFSIAIASLANWMSGAAAG